MHALSFLPLASVTSEDHLVIVLVQFAIIVGIARLFGILFRKIGQPAVVGEIVAGLLLGPSVFGKFQLWPGFHHFYLSIFSPGAAVTDTLNIFSQLGLILLLFLVGLEFDFHHLKKSRHSALAISAAGVALPFFLGFGLAHLVFRFINPPAAPIDRHGFSLFMGTAMAITAMPVLGRMMLEFNIIRTRLAAVTISAAAVDDATGWILLATVSAMVKAQYQLLATLRMIGLTLAFALFMFLVIRPLLARWINWSIRRTNGEVGLNTLAILLILIFFSAIATSLIGIFAIFGAFLLGAVLSDQHAFRHAVSKQLHNFVTVFFLPIFFTYTGLRTDINALDKLVLWLLAAAICIVAIAGKLGGCTLAARLSGFRWREALCIGSMMNTRGLMELIVVNVGYDLGIIPRSVFCILVLMALLTTFMTTPLLRAFKTGTELDAPMESSPFPGFKRRRGLGVSPISS